MPLSLLELNRYGSSSTRKNAAWTSLDVTGNVQAVKRRRRVLPFGRSGVLYFNRGTR
jgi:hypothetical protein